MRRITAIFMLFAVALMFLAVLPSEDLSADISTSSNGTIVVSGAVDLDADAVLDDGSKLDIVEGADIDIHGHSVDLGEGSDIRVIGGTSISSAGGHITVGKDSSVIMIGLAIPKMTEDYSISFDGELVINKNLGSGGGAGIQFIPNGDDHAIHISWGTSALLVYDPVMTMKSVSGGIEIEIGYAAIGYHQETYESGTLISSEDLKITSDSGDSCIDVVLNKDGAVVKSFDFSELEGIKKYHATGIEDITTMKQVGPTKMDIDSKGQQNIKTKAGSIQRDRYVNGVLESSLLFRDVSLDMLTDTSMLPKMILSRDNSAEILSDILRYLELDSSSLDAVDSKQNTRHFTDLELVIDGNDSSNAYFLFQMDEGDVHYTATAEKIDFESFSLRRDMVLDTNFSVPMITVKKEADVTTVATISDVVFRASELDLGALYDLYSRSGEIAPQQLFDCCDRLEFSMSELKVDSNGDGETDRTADALQLSMLRDGKGLNTLSLALDDVSFSMPYADGTLLFDIGYTQLYLESDGSLSECIDAFIKGIHFTRDAHAELQMTNSRFDISYQEEGKTIDVRTERISSISPATISLTMSMDHSTYRDSTVFEGKVSLIGYFLTAEVQESFAEPKGTLDAVLIADNMTGSFDLEFADGISFSTTFHMPWNLDFTYYDIEFQAEGDDMVLSVSHGNLTVDGYDYKQEGIVYIFDRMSKNDFGLDTRAVLTMDSMKIYTDDHTTLFNSFSDIELDVREISVDMERGVKRNISLDRVHLDLTYSDGSFLDRDIPHLNISKDLSGIGPGKSLLEQMAPYLTVAFILVSLAIAWILAYLRMKKPELFRLNE